MRRLMLLTVTVLGMLATAHATEAQPQAQSPCSTEVEKWCKDVPAGEGRLRACLEPHVAELSEACKQHIATTAKRDSACAADIEKFCSGVPAGKGAIRSCLSQHAEQISAECNKQLGAKRDRRRRR